MPIKIRINNGEELTVESVKIYHESTAVIADEETGVELYIQATSEGLIMDVRPTDPTQRHINLGMESETFDEIIERLTEDIK